ncbi:RNA-directed DNA polymerase [Vibrio minamisatsumaniensis]|uniref:RNA-directed DNA polymerase n=1 Tax=Vibrio minamisatsumaniensis TaxID=2910243 RepID=UPI003D24068B
MKSKIALKALNQYRKRDVNAYLGLRYYLENSATKSDHWIERVCSKLILDGRDVGYLRTNHYKDWIDNSYVYRDVFLPTPVESLSEALLISELSKHKEFHPQSYVFSYKLASDSDVSGVFVPYFNGIRERHALISKLCWENEGASVLYTDIKKFYPSIRYEDAIKVWKEKCLESDLDAKFFALGKKLLEKHYTVNKKCETGKGILTGPMFSHVIANLLLDSIDKQMYQLTKGRYCRYVDDVIFVGSDNELDLWRNELEKRFSNLGLELHDGDKDFSVTNEKWLEGQSDFNSSLSIDWMQLIGDLKKFLFAHPSKSSELNNVFIENSIRIPVLDYSSVMRESTSVQKLADWIGKFHFSRNLIRSISINSLLAKANQCRVKMLDQLFLYAEEMKQAQDYEKKRLVPKIRFLAGRLTILLPVNKLLECSELLMQFDEFHQTAVTMKAVATRNVTECLIMGSNCTQAASQLLSIEDLPVEINIEDLNGVNLNVIEQSLAVLDLNGIAYDIPLRPGELRRFSKGIDVSSLMESNDRYIKELASLHGVGLSRHELILSSCFDRDEELTLDILNQVHSSRSG